MVDYIKMVYRDHLNDTVTYTFVPESAVPAAVARIKRELLTWIKDWKEILTKHEAGKLRKLSRENEDPFPVLYVTLKAHKTPLKTRPINSCNGSLLFGLGIWVDEKIQAITHAQRSFFKSSAELKFEYTSATVPLELSTVHRGCSIVLHKHPNGQSTGKNSSINATQRALLPANTSGGTNRSL
jgi:hypothetical protein